jgi:predicted RNA-binding Zn ribbon-like protein
MQSEVVTGRLCLEFADTARAKDKDEELHSMVDVLQWAKASGLLSSTNCERLTAHYEGNRRKAAADLARAIGVRDLLLSVFSGIANGRPLRDRDLAELNSALAKTPALLRVRARAGKLGTTWDSAAEGLSQILFPILADAADFLASDRLGRVRECASAECTCLFIDESRNRSRRWCDMNACGNRMKARRHYERAKSERQFGGL